MVPRVRSDAAGSSTCSFPTHRHVHARSCFCFADDQVVANDLKRYSFTTGELYDERTAIAVLLEKLITDGGRYTKYHPNVMLALFASHGGAQSGKMPDFGVEKSKFEELKVVAKTSIAPAANYLIRSGAVTAEELRQYAATRINRQPFEDIASAPFHDVHYQKLIDGAIEASNDFSESDLARLDEHLERIRIYGANIVEAEHRHLRGMVDSCAGKHFESELSPVVLPPDDIVPDASDAAIRPDAADAPSVLVPTPTPSVIHICQIPGCRRRPESDPCGLQQASQDLCLRRVPIFGWA